MKSKNSYVAAERYRRVEGTDEDQGWYAEQQGDLIAVRGGAPWTRNRNPPRRSKIVDFSHKSRMRLLKWVARTDWNAVGKSAFLTLTYPDECKDVPNYMRTAQRWAVIKAIEDYLHRPTPILWRVEWKHRLSGEDVGSLACHIHMCLLGVPRIPWQVPRKAWGKAIGHPNPVTDIRSREGRRASRYAAKYAGKASDIGSLDYVPYLENPPEGRAWGVTRAMLVPQCPRRYSPPLEDEQIRRAQRIGSEVMERPHATGFTMFTPRAGIIFDKIVGDGVSSLPDSRLV